VKPDLGLLAEYADGLLDGTPEGAEVGARLEADPAWADAYAALIAALPEVRADLARLTPPGPMPDDVAVRLEGAVRLEAAVRWARPDHRRWWAASGAAAAALALVAGLTALWPAEQVDPGTASRSTRPTQVGQTRVTYSGTEHTPPGSLNSLSSPAGTSVRGIPPELARLTARDALVACLDAVRKATSSGPPRSVDFGRYAGTPALVVVLAGDPPRTTVAGPACGTAGADLVAGGDGPR
jgi:hypothetical protein